MKPSGNTILLTGGGSGIGRELARRWHDLGNTVIVAGRSQPTLDETADGHANIHTATVDVADAGDIARFARDVLTRFPAINVLVNNAGIMRYETIETARDLGDAEATIITNLLGPIRLVDALVTTMHEVFPTVVAIDVPDTYNTLLFASQHPLALDEIRTHFVALAQPDLQALATRAAPLLRVPPSGPLRFTDDRAPVEQVVDSMIARFALSPSAEP